MTQPKYVPIDYTAVTDPTLGKTILYGIYSANTAYEREIVVYRVDVTGAVLEDLTQYVGVAAVDGQGADQMASLSINNPNIAFDSTAELPESFNFALLGKTLIWGNDLVSVWSLMRAEGYNGGQWYGFPVGHYVVTTPGTADLNDPDVQAVTGYSKNQLIQTQPADSYSFAVGSLVLDAVTKIFVDAGLLVTGHNLSEVASYPGDWSPKTFEQPYTAPLGGGLTWIAIVNELLKLSGCQPLVLTPTGRWQIMDVLTPSTAAIQWKWAGDDDEGGFADPGFPNNSVVLDSDQAYAADVFGVPNRFVFVQDGLTFQPIEGSGQYTVNNLTHGPSSQSAMGGRVVQTIVVLQAIDQADLVKQGDQAVQQQYAQAEKITIATEPWPIAWYYDVFQFSSKNLPQSASRRVQARQWTLPLIGDDPMQWTTFVVEL